MWERLQAPRREFAGFQAISTARGAFSFASLYAGAESLATALAGAGLVPGQPVALVLPNGAAFVRTLLALFKLGVPVALVSQRYAESELRAIAAGAGLRALVTTSSHAARVAHILGAGAPIPIDDDGERVALFSLVPREAGDLALGRTPGVTPTDAAIIKFSSGSTGDPKGIALTADQVASEARNVVETLSLTHEDRLLTNVPLFHSYGFDLGLLGMLFSGASLTLPDYFVPRRIPQDLARERTTILLGVPHEYKRWLEAAPPAAALPHLRYLLSCTAPLEPETIAAFYERFQLPICQHYGSSEAGAVTTHVPSEVLRLQDSVGLPMRNVEVRIVDAQGQDLGPGKEGELVVRSGALAQGYVMGGPEDRTPFRDGAFWIGDLALRDERGFVYLRGRVDQIINIGGLKVSPEEVRRVLQAHPAVGDAAVIGIEDGRHEDFVAAAVTLAAATTEKELIAYCYSKLADYKVPRRLLILDELPRGPTGKVRLRPEHFS